MRRLIVGVALVTISAVDARAQAAEAIPVSRGRLIGVYEDQTGAPIEGAEVRNLLNGLSALTTATGTLSLFFADTTGALLSIRKVGFVSTTVAVANGPRDTVPLTIVLSRVAQTLPKVITKAKAGDSVITYFSPGLKAFEERRHKGFGHFISEAELRKRDASAMVDVVLGNIPGLADRGGQIYSGRAQGAPCWITVYLDGALYYSKANFGQVPPNFYRMPTQEYAGVEFYPGGSTLPPQYNRTDSGCGTLLLWSRER